MSRGHFTIRCPWTRVVAVTALPITLTLTLTDPNHSQVTIIFMFRVFLRIFRMTEATVFTCSTPVEHMES